MTGIDPTIAFFSWMEEVIDKGHVAVTWGEPVVWGLSDGYADECDDGLRERERGEWSVGFASRPCSWMYSSVPFFDFVFLPPCHFIDCFRDGFS